MNKFGRDDVLTLAAAAVLTGLLIFTAGRDRDEEESQSEHDRENLATFRARVPADEPMAVQNARASQPGRGRAAGRRSMAGVEGHSLATIIFSRSLEASLFLRS